MGNKAEMGLTEIHALCVDLGLTMPKEAGKIIKIRQRVVNCAGELNKKYNLGGFINSLIEMFAEFGIRESENFEDRNENREKWEMWYNSWYWKSGNNLRLVDVEILTTKGGYANMFFSKQTDGDNSPVIEVFPGPCCFPSLKNVSYQHPPVRYFYEICERVIGADPYMGRYNFHSGLNAFIVRGNSYQVLPYKTN